MWRIALITIGIIITGFVIPIAYQAAFPLPSILQDNYRRADEQFSFLFLAARIIDNDGRYPDHCRDRLLSQVLLKRYSWMMIPGSIVEVCVTTDEKGIFNGVKSIGTL